MILKTFYDEKDYEIVLRLLHKLPVHDDDIERVRTRQLFLRGIEK